MSDLLNQRCEDRVGERAMSEAAIHDHLLQVTGWRVHEGALEKTCRFKNFHETMAFVNALAWVCHTEDHYPELSVSYGHCVVRFRTHAVQGISLNDFICAARVNALVAFVG